MVSLDPPMQEFELLQQSLSQIYVVNYVTGDRDLWFISVIEC